MTIDEFVIEDAALKVLNELENREYELLAWGFVNGGFSADELEAIIETCAGDPPVCSCVDIHNWLIDHRLIFNLSVGSADCVYRTRFAETVRLLWSMRQVFKESDLDSGPRLVSDYRILMKPRVFPRRNISIADVLDQLRSIADFGPKEQNAVMKLLSYGEGQYYELSRFQLESTANIMRSIGTDQTGGTIVSAGTGTGKTLAFYLPCLATVAGKVRKNDYWTQVLAVYPRIELLKDQLSSAFRQVRSLDGIGTRPVRIGALFGDTPQSIDKQRRDLDWKCPYLRCPRCRGTLYWRRQDIASRTEALKCECGHMVNSEEFGLTRESLFARPPDVLFTTTEMLNRLMSSSNHRHLIGLGSQTTDKRPYLTLLDEVHTYNGTHGAQVAILLRRWRRMLRRPVHFVGLSATLKDAQGFFAELIGVKPASVRLVEQHPDEMEMKGREYQLVVKGDPISATALLSTSIQAVMLIARILDPLDQNVSRSLYCPKLFAFTDDLDGINRFYHNLADAERQRLARFRQPPGNARRIVDGQVWQICIDVGNRLDRPIRLDRVSSQDPGVDTISKAIVATTTLEVGYDDSEVGAVLQHKAPRDPAGFLQRKGRAGRQQKTRPWTVMVLSDYGRDRYAFQAYEQVLDPILPRPVLPAKNRYILRMQAVHALMDWVSTRADMRHCGKPGSVFDDFSSFSEWKRDRQSVEARIVEAMLTNETVRESFAQYLSNSLDIPESEVTALFWEPPRALMTSVLPTILRRLKTGWRKWGVGGAEERTSYPLPEFASATLFSDLNLPEIQLALPGDRMEEMPVAQGLREFAPGRVSKRYSIRTGEDAYWVPPASILSGTQTLPVSAFCQEFIDQSEFTYTDSQGTQTIRVIRPTRIGLQPVPKEIGPSSNARPIWKSQIQGSGDGVLFEVPSRVFVSRILKSLRFYLHNRNTPVTVRRVSVGSEAALTKRGQEIRTYCRYIDDTGCSAGIGFDQEVDGIRFDSHISDDLITDVLREEGFKSCRVSYFLHRVRQDQVLTQRANVFQLGWLAQIYLSLVTRTACMEGDATRKIIQSTANATAHDFDEVMQELFQVTPLDDDDAADEPKRPRLERSLRSLFADRDVIARLIAHAECLYEIPKDSEWRHWLRQRLRATVGAALLHACELTAKDHQASDLILDIGAGARDGECEDTSDEIWVTETTLGGSGVIEEVYRRYLDDPLRFFLLVESALGHTDAEVVDSELTRVLTLTQSDNANGPEQQIRSAFALLRNANRYEDSLAASRTVVKALLQNDIFASRGVVAALNARVLRPGTSEKSDRLLYQVVREWQRVERDRDLEIDARVYAYVAAKKFASEIRALTTEVGGSEDTSLSPFSIVYSLLWPRGVYLRERLLGTYNPFASLPEADSKLLRDAFARDVSYIDGSSENWHEQLNGELGKNGIARLIANTKQTLQQCVMHVTTRPVEIGCIFAYPYVAKTGRIDDRHFVVLHLREAVM